MIKTQLIAAYIFLTNLILPCYRDNKHNDFDRSRKSEYRIRKAGKLDGVLKEASGCIAVGDSVLLHLNDGGGKTILYQTDLSGKLTGKVKIQGVKNNDWEDLTKDDNGNIYIGDFGNNKNTRRNLKVYKYAPETGEVAEINFTYPDQHQFPPVKDSLNFDCEAFFWFNDSLWLFSKNRSGKYVKLYKLSDKSGTQVATLMGKTFLSSMINGAAISPDNSSFALIGYGKVYMFAIQNDSISFRHPALCKPFRRSGQAEGITFINENELVITNEGGKVFKMVKRKKLKK